MKCCVCGHEWPDAKGHTIKLTESEIKVVQETGGTIPDTLQYCGPCWRVLSDKTMGAQFIKGTIQSNLHAMGIPYADKWGQMLYAKLMGLKTPKG